MIFLRVFIKSVRVLMVVMLLWSVLSSIRGAEGPFWSEVRCLLTCEVEKGYVNIRTDLQCFSSDSILVSLKILIDTSPVFG